MIAWHLIIYVNIQLCMLKMGIIIILLLSKRIYSNIIFQLVMNLTNDAIIVIVIIKQIAKKIVISFS